MTMMLSLQNFSMWHFKIKRTMWASMINVKQNYDEICLEFLMPDCCSYNTWSYDNDPWPYNAWPSDAWPYDAEPQSYDADPCPLCLWQYSDPLAQPSLHGSPDLVKPWHMERLDELEVLEVEIRNGLVNFVNVLFIFITWHGWFQI